MLPELWTVPGTGWAIKSYGFLLMIGFLSGAYLAMRRATRVKCDPDVVLNCSIISLFSGIVGARIFYVVHYWDESFAFAENPLLAAVNISAGGLEIYGGLISAMIFVPLYLAFTKRSVRLYLEIMAVSTMWALGISRIGCFLNGCCYGGVCVDDDQNAKYAWAAQFPFGSPALAKQWEERQVTLPAELITDRYIAGRGQRHPASPLGRDLLAMTPEKRNKPIRNYERAKESYRRAAAADPKSEQAVKLARELEIATDLWTKHRFETSGLISAKKYPSREDPTRQTTVSELRALAAQNPALRVHPSQLYSSVSGVLLSILLGRIFHRRKRHGVVFLWMIILYGATRFLLETVRTDNPTDVAGLTASQAISIAMIAVGALMMFALYRFLPERSPRAVPFIPEPEDQDNDKKNH